MIKPVESSFVCYQELFSRVALHYPEHTAVIDEQERRSYAQLHAESDRLSLHLQRCGARPDELIVIFLSASYAYIVGSLATLKAGAAFLPIPTDLPSSQIDLILADAEPAHILTSAEHVEKIAALALEENITVLTSSLLSGDEAYSLSVSAKRERDHTLKPLVQTGPEHLAFATYTSGTTGTPKGVLQIQSAMVHSYQSRHAYRPYGPDERVACNIFFMWEILRPLMCGAAVVVIPDNVIAVPKKLTTLLRVQQVTEVLFTPSAFQRLLRSVDPHALRADLSGLRTIWLNGEVVSSGLVREGIAAIPESAQLLNTYSICECHDVSNTDLLALNLEQIDAQHEGVCPVGSAVEGVEALVMSQDQLTLSGEGELYISGQGLGRGYLHREELTQSRFPVVDGVRYYATGDQASIDDQGVVTIKGRLHSMVKMRGYSVYLGAVEAALHKHSLIKDARVFLRGHHLSQRLVAFLVPASASLMTWVDDSTQSAPRVREWLSELLPAYMIPSQWVILESFPVHPISGKLDQDALKSLERVEISSLELLKSAPQSSPEDRLLLMRQLWARALEVELTQIHERAHFFELGGHSLSAVDLVVSVEEVFGVNLEGDELYNSPHLSAFMSVVFSGGGKRGAQLHRDSIADRFWSDEDISLALPPHHPYALRSMEQRGRRESADLASSVSLSEARVILLTGATGYLGLGLLEGLLRRTAHDVEVVCLVRRRVDDLGQVIGGVQRLDRALSESGLSDLGRELNDGRVTVIEGDISQRHLGLTDELYQQLAERVEVIFHCAALVNLRAPYLQTKPSIVNGTRHVIHFALHDRIKTLHHISTNSVVARAEDGPCGETDTLEGLDADLTDGYSQAKWVAEHLVEEAVRIGLPATIYRPGNIGPHRVTGFANPHDLHQLIWRACAEVRVAPLNTGWRFEFIPVDQMSTIILELAELQAPQLRYHLVHPHPIDADSLFRGWLEAGRLTKSVDGWRAWKTELIGVSADGVADRPHLRVLASALAHLEEQLKNHVSYRLDHLSQDLPARAQELERQPELHHLFKELLL